jgi:hypothetical protein
MLEGALLAVRLFEPPLVLLDHDPAHVALVKQLLYVLYKPAVFQR